MSFLGTILTNVIDQGTKILLTGMAPSTPTVPTVAVPTGTTTSQSQTAANDSNGIIITVVGFALAILLIVFSTGKKRRR